jgi:hypothetical protein
MSKCRVRHGRHESRQDRGYELDHHYPLRVIKAKAGS